MSDTDRELLARVYHDTEAAAKAAKQLWPDAPPAVQREAAADFMVHVRELRRNGKGSTPPAAAPAEPAPACPVCQGAMKDQRGSKRGNQPDFKCRTRDCDGAVWLTKRPRSTTS